MHTSYIHTFIHTYILLYRRSAWGLISRAASFDIERAAGALRNTTTRGMYVCMYVCMYVYEYMYVCMYVYMWFLLIASFRSLSSEVLIYGSVC